MIFAFFPPPQWPGPPVAPDIAVIKGVAQHRLFGWQRDPLLPRMTPLLPKADGSLWSEELASFLLPDEQQLRLADAAHHLRLTGEEAQAQVRWVAEQQDRAAERLARAEARRAVEQQLRQLLEKLRVQDIDPEQL